MERYIINTMDYGPFQVSLEPDETDGGYVVECLDLEGCISEGDTKESAIANIMEAIDGVCESMMEHHGRIVRTNENLNTTYSGWTEESYSNTAPEYA